MSWFIDITTDRPVDLDTARAIVADLPRELHGWLGASENPWGWSAATDIQRPVDCCWRISGAGFSRPSSGYMADSLAARLRLRGYAVTVGERDD